MVTWSYSSIKTFDQCPKKYYHLKVAKDVVDVAGPAADYGTQGHTAAEFRVKDGTPLPPKFNYMEPFLATLLLIPGVKHAEIRMGIRKTKTGYEACDFTAPDAWWRGIADLIIINGRKAHAIDYKTGKSAKYADMRQLDLVAAAIFLHYPEVEIVKSALAFVVSNEFIHKRHYADKVLTYLSVFDNQLDRLEAALETGVWNPNSSPLCGWCPVKACENHYTPRKR